MLDDLTENFVTEYLLKIQTFSRSIWYQMMLKNRAAKWTMYMGPWMQLPKRENMLFTYVRKQVFAVTVSTQKHLIRHPLALKISSCLFDSFI